jgi:hypothetical protein
MANKVVLKRSAVQGKTPVVGDLALGELALNTYDGNLFFKKDDGTASILSVATLTGTQTLTNKTLTSPTITGAALSGTFSGAHTYSGVVTLSDSTASTTTATGALKVAGGVGVGDSVYVGNRVGFVNASNVSAVYQVYNAATSSLDTVFG